MRTLFLFALSLSTSSAIFAQGAPQPAPQTVEILSGSLRLKGFLWKPQGLGPFPAVVFNHGRSDTPQLHSRPLNLRIEDAAEVLGPVFVRHGFVFLYPFRRGEGLSADQGQFIGDLLEREEKARGAEARNHLRTVLMTTDHLQDAQAALRFLKGLSYIDPRRVAVAGHSFGGGLTLLEASRDSTVAAAVTFGAAAGSWEGSPELRDLLLKSLHTVEVPVMMIQAENDYSLAPSKAMDEELSRLSKPHVRKIYPAFGQTPSEGHNFLYYDVPLWEQDVFAFLDANLKRHK
jgi:carboxymethylenebutenolidase